MYYDSHVHIGCPKPHPTTEKQHWFGYSGYIKTTPEKFIKFALGHSVIRALAFPFPFPECGIAQLNSDVINAAKRYPYFFTSLLLSPSVSELEEYAAHCAGVKGHFYVQGRIGLPNPKVLELLEAQGKVYLFHAHANAWEDQIKYLVQNFKKLKIIVAHCARLPTFKNIHPLKWLNEVSSWIPRSARENVFFETSNIRDVTIVKHVIQHFGATQVLWGSDFPYAFEAGEDVLQREIEIIENTIEGEPEAQLIRTGNFKRLFLSDTWTITHADAGDANELKKVLSGISTLDSKYLALHLKRNVVLDRIRKASHLLVARGEEHRIAGFLRWSDRPMGRILIEEIYILPEFRSKGIARKLIENVCASFQKAEAKSYADNVAMATVFERLGFKAHHTPKGTMINWERVAK